MKRRSREKVVYVVHCVDVEGPMTETVAATWERIAEGEGLRVPHEPTRENLAKLQRCELELDVSREKLELLAAKYSAGNLAYLTDWDAIDASMAKIVTPEARRRYADKEGGGYKFSWFIYDHYGFTTNPRYHDDGIHHVFDHYHDLFLRDDAQGDGVYWHYHHVPSSGDALEWCTNWNLNGVHEEILARRIIERNWFPSVFRAGGHIERNDLSHWLEMLIPFDFSGRTPHGTLYQRHRGAVHDWRHAPKEWGCWHPDWYDYRRPGSMRRRVFRCLDLKTWMFSITERDVFEAFELAHFTGKSVLGYYNHDYRDMKGEVDHVYPILHQVQNQFPDVTWRFVNALDAAKGYLGDDDVAPRFEWELHNGLLDIYSDRPLFGPAPYLAICEGGRFFRDHPTCEDDTHWSYHFRRPAEVEAFGIAGNSPLGNTGLTVHRGRLRSRMDSATASEAA